MSNLDQRLEPCGEDVVAKVIDGEAIIIRLADGIYYSMDKVGGFVWTLIEERRSLKDIAARVAGQYGITEAQALTDLQALVGELAKERLVRDAKGEIVSRPSSGAPPAQGAYEPPKLNIYSDMGDLLALDPPAPGVQDIPWKA
jgi:hypothetical protein